MSRRLFKSRLAHGPKRTQMDTKRLTRETNRRRIEYMSARQTASQIVSCRLVSLVQATAKNVKMEEVREYMGVRKLPKALQLRMRKHFDHVYRNTSVFRQARADLSSDPSRPAVYVQHAPTAFVRVVPFVSPLHRVQQYPITGGLLVLMCRSS